MDKDAQFPTTTAEQINLQIGTVETLVAAFEARAQNGEITNLTEAGAFLVTWRDAMRTMTK